MCPEDRPRLRDGRPATIRVADASDGVALRVFFVRLSRETVKQRFHFAFRELPEHLLSKVAATAHSGTTIFLAESSTHPGSGAHIVGEARYVRMNDSPTLAEVAVVVADECRRVGLGSQLVSRLLDHARHAGVQRLIAYVSRENEPIVALLRAFGARYVPGSIAGGDIQMQINLDPLTAPSSSTSRLQASPGRAPIKHANQAPPQEGQILNDDSQTTPAETFGAHVSKRGPIYQSAQSARTS